VVVVECVEVAASGRQALFVEEYFKHFLMWSCCRMIAVQCSAKLIIPTF